MLKVAESENNNSYYLLTVVNPSNISRLPVDMLGQILYYKTIDYGKIFTLILIIFKSYNGYSLPIGLLQIETC